MSMDAAFRANAPTRECTRCHVAQPISHFRPCVRDGSKRHAHCNTCHARRERERLKRRRDQANELGMSTLACRLAGSPDVLTVARFVRRAIGEFGGSDKFVDAAISHVQYLRATKPTSKALGNWYLAIMRLWHWVDLHRPPESETADEKN